MEWWLWLSIGLGLAALEIFLMTGFFVFLFGVAGILVGGLTWLGAAGSETTQWVIWVIFSVILVVLARKKLMMCVKRSVPPTGVDYAGSEVTVNENIHPGEFGKGELRGSHWTIKNESNSLLRAGTRVVVSQVDGVTLIIK